MDPDETVELTLKDDPGAATVLRMTGLQAQAFIAGYFVPAYFRGKTTDIREDDGVFYSIYDVTSQSIPSVADEAEDILDELAGEGDV
jgi:hypothetical protein